MNLRRARVSIAVLVLIACTATGRSVTVIGAPKAEDDFQIVKVADGLYAAIAKSGGLASGNAGFVIGNDGVLIFDTFYTPAAIEELIAEIQTLTKLPIKYAVNSHYHLDHTGGNQVLVARGVPIIAHDNVMIWQTVKNKRFLPAPEDLAKRKADAEKQLANTPGDQAEKRTQLERTGWSKTLPNLVDATVNDWVPTLDQMLKQYPTAKFVPGHGSLAQASDIKDFRDYLDDLRTRVKQGIAKGLTVDEAKQQLTLPEKYKSFAFQNFAVPNVDDMYKELKGTKQAQ